MSEGSIKLQYARKTLRARWEEAKADWHDQVRQDFEDHHLAPLEDQVALTIQGMQLLAEMLTQAKRDLA